MQNVEPDATQYELRAANTVVMCDSVAPSRDFLIDMMTRHKFGAGNEPEQYGAGSIKALAKPLMGTALLPSINLRWDRDLGLSFALSGRAIESQYVIPRITWIFENNQWSFELMWSNSASRFISPYVSMGAAWQVNQTRAPDGSIVEAPDKTWEWVSEMGMKFRVQMPGKLKVLTLGQSFGGFRLGFRFNGFNFISQGRIIVEIGAGVW